MSETSMTANNMFYTNSIPSYTLSFETTPMQTNSTVAMTPLVELTSHPKKGKKKSPKKKSPKKKSPKKKSPKKKSPKKEGFLSFTNSYSAFSPQSTLSYSSYH